MNKLAIYCFNCEEIPEQITINAHNDYVTIRCEQCGVIGRFYE